MLTEAEALMRGDETAYDALDDAGYTMEQPYRSTGRVKWAAWKLLPPVYADFRPYGTHGVPL